MSPKAVAVVGSSQQLGALIVDRLVAHPQVERIVAIDSVPPLAASPKVEAVDPATVPVEQCLGRCRVLIHTGELNGQETGLRLERLLQVAVERSIRKVICVTSVAAYGPIPDHPVPLTEESPRRVPHDGRPHRLAFDTEATLDAFEQTYPEVQIVRLRPGLLFGARAATVPARAMRHGWCPELATAEIPVVWDEDVADAAMLALDKDVRGPFNLVVGETQGLSDLARHAGLRVVRMPASIARALIQGQGSGAQLLCKRCDPHWLAIADTALYVSSKRAREELGWRPRYTTAPEVIDKYLDTAPRRLNMRIAAFFGMFALSRYLPAKLPGADAAPATRVRLVLTGEDGGEVGLCFERNKLQVLLDGIAHPSVAIHLPARLFLELLAGRMEPAEVLRTGQVWTQGDLEPHRALEILVSLRSAGQTKKPWAFPVRWMTDWISQGA